MDTIDPDFPTRYGDGYLHPVAAWRLWVAMQCEGDDFKDDPVGTMECILPDPVVTEFPNVFDPLWASLFGDRFTVLEERLAVGDLPLATCTADELIVRWVAMVAKDQLIEGIPFRMPDSLVAWMLTEEGAMMAEEITDAVDLDGEIRGAITEDFDVDILFDERRYRDCRDNKELCYQLGIGDQLFNPARWFEPFYTEAI